LLESLAKIILIQKNPAEANWANQELLDLSFQTKADHDLSEAAENF
jgi:hypothetical protein